MREPKDERLTIPLGHSPKARFVVTMIEVRS
jgi:hypothetical protein